MRAVKMAVRCGDGRLTPLIATPTSILFNCCDCLRWEAMMKFGGLGKKEGSF